MKNETIYFYPMKMFPVFKNYIWGGNRLKQFNKLSSLETIAESWELSCHPDGKSRIANGMYKDQILEDIIAINPLKYMGHKIKDQINLPIMIKLIDANKKLSIQVHPSDKDANIEFGENAKSECWYIVDCEPGSFIYCGFNRDVSYNEFLLNLNEGNICDLLNKIEVKKGDMFFIPAGTIHALGENILVAEIQQNSNTTFRIFDYNRKDIDGNLRPLHIDRAKETLNFSQYDYNSNAQSNMFECEYFQIEKCDISGSKPFIQDQSSFSAILFLGGHGQIICEETIYKFIKGDCFFIPANILEYSISGTCECLIIKL